MISSVQMESAMQCSAVEIVGEVRCRSGMAAALPAAYSPPDWWIGRWGVSGHRLS
jgi:hypothetical protein